MKWRAIVILTISGLLDGCVFHSAYPKDWPALPVASTNECPVVTGRYENFFSASTTPRNVPALSVLLGLDRGVRVLEFVQHPDHKLIVKAATKKSFRLTRATDGSLVVRQRTGGIVLLLGLIPAGYASSEDTWHRFAPWNPTTHDAQEI